LVEGGGCFGNGCDGGHAVANAWTNAVGGGGSG